LTGKLGKEERSADDISLEERRDMALGVQRASFEHIATRVVLALSSSSKTDTKPALVMAGGVASNAFLRHVLASTLVLHGHGDVQLFFPPPKYCTDNAAMIGWTAIEMFEAGYKDSLAIRAVRKWPLDDLLKPKYDDKI
jgi:N6-L-threonylcarbamoyladenine synthase